MPGRKQAPAYNCFLESQGILYQLCSRFLNINHHSMHEGERTIFKISDSINFILDNLNGQLSVAGLSARVNLNADYFSRQFMLYSGIRPAAFIQQKRIERAQYLLATSSMNFTEISLDIGFDDLARFSKTFKKITGLTPGTYKKQIYLVGF